MTTAEIQLNDPQTLYRRWEDQQWSPFDIDLSRDKEQWPQMSDERPRPHLLGALLADGCRGADHDQVLGPRRRIRQRGGGHVPGDPAGRRGAAHAVLRALSGRGGRRPGRDLGSRGGAREQVSPAFRKIFDEALVEAHEALVASPGDVAAKVRFVTIYHLILESTLGLTSFRFITRYLKRRSCCPGSSRATRRSTTTRPGTSATASGSCVRRSARTRMRRTRSAPLSGS